MPALLLALVAGLAPSATAASCPADDFARAAPVTADGVAGDPARLTAADAPPEGTPWDAPAAVRLASTASSLVVDLGRDVTVRALTLQADNDDSYRVQQSLDGRRWQPLAVARPFGGSGLRTRTLALPAAATLRYLRVAAVAGDGHFAVGHLGAFCGVPAAAAPTRVHAALDDADMVRIKGALAAVGLLVLLLGVRRHARPSRLRDAALLVTAALSFAAFWNFGRFHYDSFVHVHEHFHYYLGAKYAPELGYTRLYECTVVAEAVDDPARALAHRRIRDLETRQLRDVAPVVANPDACTRHFTPERWRAFVRDVGFFRSQTSAAHWRDSMLTDYGFNGTPAWTLLARPLASTGAASRAQILALAAIDPVLLVILWLVVWWAFGWRVACAGLIFWGTNYPARFWWNGGAFLRMDWLLASVAGVALLRRRQPFAAGLCLGYATMLRVFPGAMLAAIALGAVWSALRRRSLAPVWRRRRLWCGAALVVVVLGAASTLASGRGSWRAFAENSARHHASVMTNHVGVRTILSFSFAGRAVATRDARANDPWSGFIGAHERTFAARRPLYVVANLVLLVLVVSAARRRADWQTAILGLGLVPFATYLACYYYSFLLLYALLAVETRARGFAAATVALAAFGCLVATVWPEHDDQFVVLSAAIVAFCAVAAAWGAFGESRVAARHRAAGAQRLRGCAELTRRMT